MNRLKLDGHDTYIQSCLEIAGQRLGNYVSMTEISRNIDRINRYPNLNHIEEPKNIIVLEDTDLDTDAAVKAVLDGRLFAEHTAAGEAIRLGLGAKFLLAPHKMSVEGIATSMAEELGRSADPQSIALFLDKQPAELLPLSLGQRHFLQASFDIVSLAEKMGVDPKAALGRQKLLLIVNEATAKQIVRQVVRNRFFGFSPQNFLFMVQKAYHGISHGPNGFFYDTASPKRLHNHGHMALQETMDKEIFRAPKGEFKYLESDEFEDILAGAQDKVSYNIEDLDYLTGSLDMMSLALALNLIGQEVRMAMEVVANNPENPQKGGMAAFDAVYNRDVMIESFQLMGYRNEDIRFLNRNFNHYPDPVHAWRALKEGFLPMPVAIKDDFLYFQPVQGDINFLVPTFFFRRKTLRPVNAWKSTANTVAAINAAAQQDRQPGFGQFAAKFTPLTG